MRGRRTASFATIVHHRRFHRVHVVEVEGKYLVGDYASRIGLKLAMVMNRLLVLIVLLWLLLVLW